MFSIRRRRKLDKEVKLLIISYDSLVELLEIDDSNELHSIIIV
jgi:hypothetical protein